MFRCPSILMANIRNHLKTGTIYSSVKYSNSFCEHFQDQSFVWSDVYLLVAA